METFINKIFSITNNDNHKIITFLGIKIKRRIFKREIMPPVDIHNNNNNIILIHTNGYREFNPQIPGLEVIMYGENNTLILHEPIKFESTRIEMIENNATCLIYSSKYVIKNLHVFKMTENSTLTIGENFSALGVFISFSGSINLSVKIGDDCMFSHNIIIQPTDSHSIFDKDTLKIFNEDSNIVIGNHVWLAPYVSVLKGCQIADNCVIGIHSVVTKSIHQPNTVNVGNPTRIIKKNIDWSIDSPRWLREHLKNKKV